ncbi:MAG: hypothetical protein ACFB8W_17070 [Elainellaceae cyanobacterium]
MSSQSNQIVGIYPTRNDADYAIQALTTMAGFQRDTLDVAPCSSDESEGEDQYCLTAKGPVDVVNQARSFLGDPPLPETEEPFRSPYGLKHARDLMAFDDFG